MAFDESKWLKKYAGGDSGSSSSPTYRSASSETSSTKKFDEDAWLRKYAAPKATSSQPSTPTLPTTESTTKPEKKETVQSNPGAINALGAGGYGADKGDRVRKTVKGAAQESGSGLLNLLGMFADKAAESRNDNVFIESKFTDKSAEELLDRNAKEGVESQKALYEKSDELAEKSEKNISEAKDGLGKVGQALVDVGVYGSQLVGDTAANLIAPGAGMAMMIARASGSSARNARNQGMDVGKQYLSAIKTGSIAWATEKMFGAFGKLYGKGAADDIVEDIVKKIGKSDKGRSFLRWLINAGGEGVEEITEDLLNAGADKLLKTGDGNLDLGEVLYDGLLGTIMGGFGSGAQIINGNYKAKNEALKAQKAFANAVADSINPNSETASVVGEIVAKAENGEALTADDVQTLADALETATVTETESVEPTAEKVQPMSAVEAVVKAAKAEAEQSAEEPAQTEEPVQSVDKFGNPLPEGMGAASADFTGEMSPAEKWVAEAQGKGDDALHPVSDTAVKNLAEQQHRAPQEVPKVDLNGHLTSKTVSTVANSGVTPQKMSDAILEDAAQGKFSHIAHTDTEAMTTAEETIEHYGWEQALGQYRQNVLDGKVSKDNTALGITLYNNAVTNNDFATAMDILTLMTKNSTTMAQGLQAMNILNKLTPDGRLYAALKSIENISEEMKKKYGLDEDIEIDPNLISEYRDALESGDKEAIKEAWGNLQQNIADQIPSTWKDKLNAWRYLAMLGNLRTHIRNIVGNFGFAPVRGVKNVLATGIEAVTDKVSKNGIGRTKAMLNPASATDRTLMATAWANYEEASQAIMSGGKFNDLPNEINDRRTIFGSKSLEAVRKFNTNALNAEDKWFSQPAYSFALAGYLKANGISAQAFADGSIGETAKAEAMKYAVEEAQKATYRDTNAFSKAVSKWKVKPAAPDASMGEKILKGAGNMIVEGLLPFKKTPANILARAVEYSPAGLAYYIATGSKSIKNGEMTAAEFIDGLASGLTGTGILALGAYLAAQGLLSGGGDDNDELDKLQGIQDYALNVGGKSYTLDWLAPEALPLFVGVELWNKCLDSDAENRSFWSFAQALGSLADPITEMSMLSGVQDMISSIKYSNNAISAAAVQLATGYISQFIPTLGGQIERSFLESESETTFVDKSSSTPSNMQRFWGKLLNKVPGVDYNQIPYIDAWGRTNEADSFAKRAFENLVSPSYINDITETAVDEELKRLHDAGNTGVYPVKPRTDTKIDGEYLTADEYVKYATVRGTTSLDVVGKVIGSGTYKNMSDAEKADAIEYAYKYANNVAKLSVKPNADVPKWVIAAKNSSNPTSAVIKQAVANKK